MSRGRLLQYSRIPSDRSCCLWFIHESVLDVRWTGVAVAGAAFLFESRTDFLISKFFAECVIEIFNSTDPTFPQYLTLTNGSTALKDRLVGLLFAAAAYPGRASMLRHHFCFVLLSVYVSLADR
jgi:hypothetical protein